MDATKRGLIEQRIEDELEGWLDNQDINWVSDIAPISSKQDLLLGFTVGKLTAIAWTYLENPTSEDLEEVRKIIERRLPEIRTKILRELSI